MKELPKYSMPCERPGLTDINLEADNMPVKKRRKISRKAVTSLIIDNIVWVIGSAMYSVAIVCFALPNEIAQSGTSGLAIIINHLLGTPIGLTNLVLNIPLIILAWIFIGWKFVSKTLWVTVILSALLDILNPVMPAYKGDPLLAALFCGAISGVGLAVVIMRGATTGGTDIIGKLVRRAFPHVTIGRIIMVTDAFIIVLAAVVFKNAESALYAAVVMFVSSQTMDYFLYGTGHGKMLMVFTNHADAVAKEITGRTKRGVSIIPAKGGYTGELKSMLLCVVRSSEVHKINKIVRSVDEKTFTIIAEANEVIGEGFKAFTSDL